MHFFVVLMNCRLMLKLACSSLVHIASHQLDYSVLIKMFGRSSNIACSLFQILFYFSKITLIVYSNFCFRDSIIFELEATLGDTPFFSSCSGCCCASSHQSETFRFILLLKLTFIVKVAYISNEFHYAIQFPF